MSVSDEALLAGMAAGDREAAAGFVRRFQARVYGLARAIVGVPAQAEEIAQETFVRAWRNAGAYDPRRGRVETWVLTIARKAAVDVLRVRHEVPVEPQALVAVLTAGATAGHLYAYQGRPSWIYVTLNDAPAPGRYTVMLTAKDGRRWDMGECVATGGYCGAGATITIPVDEIGAVRLERPGGPALVAELP